jgi:hypothetical protein
LHGHQGLSPQFLNTATASAILLNSVIPDGKPIMKKRAEIQSFGSQRDVAL